jgi:hypothetical protein
MVVTWRAAVPQPSYEPPKTPSVRHTSIDPGPKKRLDPGSPVPRKKGCALQEPASFDSGSGDID